MLANTLCPIVEDGPRINFESSLLSLDDRMLFHINESQQMKLIIIQVGILDMERYWLFFYFYFFFFFITIIIRHRHLVQRTKSSSGVPGLLCPGDLLARSPNTSWTGCPVTTQLARLLQLESSQLQGQLHSLDHGRLSKIIPTFDLLMSPMVFPFEMLDSTFSIDNLSVEFSILVLKLNCLLMVSMFYFTHQETTPAYNTNIETLTLSEPRRVRASKRIGKRKVFVCREKQLPIKYKTVLNRNSPLLDNLVGGLDVIATTRYTSSSLQIVVFTGGNRYLSHLQ